MSAAGAIATILFFCFGLPLLARLPVSGLNSTEPRDLLRALGFSDSEIGSIDRGQPLAKVVDTDRRQIAVAGAVRIRSKRDRLLLRYRSVEYLKGGEMVLNVGTFSNPPRAEDLHPLPFEEYDLDLRDCRPGDCRVRLSVEDIARFHREVDWNGSDWRTKSAAVWRDLLAGYGAVFRSRGPAALPIYANKPEALSVRDEFQVLLGESTFLSTLAPEFWSYLRDRSAVPAAGLETMLYWSKEDFGVRPVMRVTEQTVYTSKAGDGSTPAIVATTQVYADHYLDAALGLTLALETDASGSNPCFYLISVNRARTRSLTGFFRTMVRSAVQNRSRDAMLKILKSTKLSLEAVSAR